MALDLFQTIGAQVVVDTLREFCDHFSNRVSCHCSDIDNHVIPIGFIHGSEVGCITRSNFTRVLPTDLPALVPDHVIETGTPTKSSGEVSAKCTSCQAEVVDVSLGRKNPFR